MIAFLAALLMGIAESYRGARRGMTRILEKFVLGALALLALVGPSEVVSMASDWRFSLAYLLLFSAGCSVSWGAVIGGSLNRDTPEEFRAHIDRKKDRGDWYLVGPFRRSPLAGLFGRSLVWGVCASLPLFLFGYSREGVAMFCVYSTVMVMAVKFLHAVQGSRFDRAVGRLCDALVEKSGPWPRHEVYRGWIAGVLLLAYGTVV